jgi:Domain of unknown function (DUF4129)
VQRVLIAGLLLCAAAQGASARDAVQVIDECMARLDSSLDVGYERIAERCPELTPALERSPFAGWLPAGWKSSDSPLSAAGLSELRTLLARAAEARPLRPAVPDPQRVGDVLASLKRDPPTELGWWARFKDWLHRLMRAQPQGDPGWLLRELQWLRLSQSSLELIRWLCLGVVVALAVSVVVQEARVAGLIRRRRSASASQRNKLGSPAVLALAQVDAAAPREQPALLLELIALRLVERALLPPARTLTARELLRSARLPRQPAGAQLSHLVGVCERIRFADEPIGEAARAEALHAGRALLAAISSLPLPAAQPHPAAHA